MRTRDLARFDDRGYLTLVDRTSDMIITGGYNVYPREVEDALMAHPAVAGAAVVGAPDPTWVEAVTAFVTLRPGPRSAGPNCRTPSVPCSPGTRCPRPCTSSTRCRCPRSARCCAGRCASRCGPTARRARRHGRGGHRRARRAGHHRPAVAARTRATPSTASPRPRWPTPSGPSTPTPRPSVAVLHGEGGTFCAGADLRAVGTPAGNRTEPDGDGPMGPTRLRLSKPVIAAIAGHAVAGGLELALWCDLRVADETAVLGVYCRRWGVPLIDGGTVRLPRLIGTSRAMDLVLTGRSVDAAEALQIGLVNRVVAAGQALAEAAGAGRPDRRPSRRPACASDRASLLEQDGLDEAAALANEFAPRHDLAGRRRRWPAPPGSPPARAGTAQGV